MKRLCALLCLSFLGACPPPGWAGFAGSQTLDRLIEDAIKKGHIPGAVLLVSSQGQVLHRKAYGLRSAGPPAEPMTADTVFDVASLTKVVATTPCVMKLLEQGKIRLADRVTQYLPEFQGGASEITVRQLLTHFSGLRPDLDLDPPWMGYQTAISMALRDAPVASPGERFIYSDINFLLLGEIVRRVSGKPLDEFARETVFEPLGMKWTAFLPPAAWRGRIAPTESLAGEDEPLRGVVHDPTARYMGGVAGHAGLFSTADDLARFAGMMLGLGSRGRTCLFSPLTVRASTEPQSPPGQPVLRGLGWDIDSPYSSPRGELFPVGSYGHTGFTGVSLWIDPSTRIFVILLSNSVHPKPRTGIVSLRARVATAAAAAAGVDAPGVTLVGYNEASTGVRRTVARNGQVMTGLDVLAEQKFAPLAGKRVGLITNHTGLDRQGRRNVDLMLASGISVTALFSPEHGASGGLAEGADVADGRDAATSIPIWSLYAAGRSRPTSEMLRDVDVLVCDLQDAGARFYTYAATMAYAMEEAARRSVPFYVLDRPNPINGALVEGPVLDADLTSFLGYCPLPLRHGMTLGELAGLFNAKKRIGADLHVIRMRGWQRGDWFDSTGLTWTSPSPNLRNVNAALLYPAVAMLEATPGYSVGRGTDAPFEQAGAEWMRGRDLAAYLNSRWIPGVRFYATRFRPSSSALAGTDLEGVRFVITDREAFRAQRLGLEIAAALLRLYPGRVSLRANRLLIGSEEVMRALESGADPVEIERQSQQKAREFAVGRKEFVLY